MYTPIVIVGFALLFACLLRAVVEPRVVSRGSMKPTLHPGDRILAFKTRGSLFPVKAGDIVVLREPTLSRTSTPRASTVNNPESSSLTVCSLLHRRKSRPRDLIKRVVAKGHDTVFIARGVVFVNGLPSPWVGKNAPHLTFGPYKVPEDSLFVLGEDLAISRDSRDFGPVVKSLLVGKVFAVYWPARRIRLL